MGAFGPFKKKRVRFDVSQLKVTPGFWKGQLSLIPRTTLECSHPMPSGLPNTVTTKSTPTDLPDTPRTATAMQERHGGHGRTHTQSALEATKGTSASLSCLRFPPAAETPRTMVPKRAVLMLAAASPGNLLEMRVLRPHTLRKGPAICGLTRPLEVWDTGSFDML